MIRLINLTTGLTVEVKNGFSWTNFFFGFFVPAFRGMFGHAAIQVLASMVTFGLSGFYFPFVINKEHVRTLLQKGYVPATEADVNQVMGLNIGFNKAQREEVKGIAA